MNPIRRPDPGEGGGQCMEPCTGAHAPNGEGLTYCHARTTTLHGVRFSGNFRNGAVGFASEVPRLRRFSKKGATTSRTVPRPQARVNLRNVWTWVLRSK